MLSSARNDPSFVQVAPLEMNTENFDAGDHGVEKTRAANDKTLGQLETPQDAKWVSGLPLIPVLARTGPREMGMVLPSLGFKTWHLWSFLDRVRRFMLHFSSATVPFFLPLENSLTLRKHESFASRWTKTAC